MQKFIVGVIIMCVVVLQCEIVLLLVLERQNIKVWNAQADLNQSMIEALSATCSSL